MIFEQPVGYLFILIILVLFALGLARIIIGLFRKKTSLMKSGLFLSLIPFLAIGLIMLYSYINENLTMKPNKNDLIGIYKIKNIDGKLLMSNYENAILEFKSDGTYSLSQLNESSICNNGKYDLDYQFEDNVLSFECKDGFYAEDIVRNFKNFQIKIRIDDSEIFFEKIPAK